MISSAALDVVSTTIHGGGAAMNDNITGKIRCMLIVGIALRIKSRLNPFHKIAEPDCRMAQLRYLLFSEIHFQHIQDRCHPASYL